MLNSNPTFPTLTFPFGTDMDQIKENQSFRFETWIKTLTGIAFGILAACILKYGSQLESTITESINLRTPISRRLEGYDIKTLSLTILLTSIFASRALVDFLFAFSLLHENLNKPAVMLCIIISGEIITSLAVVLIMKRRKSAAMESGQQEDLLRIRNFTRTNTFRSPQAGNTSSFSNAGDNSPNKRYR
jgi:hypothetical protein